jgi:predicted transcriptional regulator
MKLPITDQFLYDLLEGTSDTAHFIFKRRRTFGDVLPGPKNPIFEKYRKMKNRQKFNKLIYYLKKNNLIKVKNLKDNNAILLTKEGKEKAIRASFKTGVNQQKERKDGKWIMIIFDIPQIHKKQRTLLRSVLVNLGYKMFQQSVWVSPYDIFEKTEKSLQFYFLDKYVRIFLVNEL